MVERQSRKLICARGNCRSSVQSWQEAFHFFYKPRKPKRTSIFKRRISFPLRFRANTFAIFKITSVFSNFTVRIDDLNWVFTRQYVCCWWERVYKSLPVRQTIAPIVKWLRILFNLTLNSVFLLFVYFFIIFFQIILRTLKFKVTNFIRKHNA